LWITCGKGEKMKVKLLFNSNEHIDIYSYLKKKGIENVEEYLQPSMNNEEPPELYENMEEGYNALVDAVKNILANQKNVDKKE
jgi:uncharacterized protein YeeX (DUF496 family)